MSYKLKKCRNLFNRGWLLQFELKAFYLRKEHTELLTTLITTLTQLGSPRNVRSG